MSQTMVLPLTFSIWSGASDKVAHYQACFLSLVLKFLHSQLNKTLKLKALGYREFKITQYADDNVFLKILESMSILLELLERVERCSGLKIKQMKSEAMWLGKWKSREDTSFNLKWQKDSVFALGTHFSTSKKVSDKLNFHQKN